MTTPALDPYQCGACRGAPTPTYVVLDVPGVGRVAVCSDPASCRRHATALGTWRTYNPAVPSDQRREHL